MASEIDALISDPVGYFTSSLEFLAKVLGLDLYSTIALVLGAVLVVILLVYLLVKRKRTSKEPEIRPRLAPIVTKEKPKPEPVTAPKPAPAPAPAPAAEKVEIEASAIQIEPRGDKFVIKLITPEVRKAAEKVIEVPKVVEKIVEVPKAVELPAVKPRAASVKSINIESAKSIDEAMTLIADKYGISAITLANPEGLVISSTSNTPDEDAAQAAFLYDSMTSGKYKLGEGLRYVEIAGSEMKYLLSAPYKDTRIISLVKSKNKLESSALDMLAEDLKAGMKMIFA